MATSTRCAESVRWMDCVDLALLWSRAPQVAGAFAASTQGRSADTAATGAHRARATGEPRMDRSVSHPRTWTGVATLAVVLAVTGAACGGQTAKPIAASTSAPTITEPPSTTAPTATTVAPTTSKPRPTTTRPTTTRRAVPTTAAPARNCDPAYPDACLHDGIGDYDCAGGSGNGPNYVDGPIRVLPPDPFDLDRDGDGVGCEG